jgi:glycosyltransferase involved in cell wall biosynthesis
LLVAVPCLNEAGNIGQVVREIRYHAPGARVLVVDDGSGDATAEAARAEGAAVLVNRRNLGIGASLKRAFALALSSGHARLVRMDGDGQHDPAYLSALLQPLEAGEADVVIGSRYLVGGAEGDGSTTSLRRGSRKLFALLVQVYTGRRFSDPNSGMWAYSRPAMGFLAHADLFDYPEGDMLIALQRAGFRVVEVPVRMRPRRAGRSSLSLASALSYLLQVGLHPIFDPDTRPGSGLSQYSPSPLP